MENLNCAPTGRLTYRQLGELIGKMSDSQLDCDVTIEDNSIDECYAAELLICDEDHQLDNFHPVIGFIWEDEVQN